MKNSQTLLDFLKSLKSYEKGWQDTNKIGKTRIKLRKPLSDEDFEKLKLATKNISEVLEINNEFQWKRDNWNSEIGYVILPTCVMYLSTLPSNIKI